MPTRDDPFIVSVSAIEHYSYCRRQCALIHVEHVYEENVHTLSGTMAHERADEPITREEAGVRVERALPIFSDALGLYGRADVVEFHPDGSIVPVEYKIGPRKADIHDDLQLCAQAACLEEMFGKPVERGAVFHVASKHRREVDFTDDLKARMIGIVQGIREMMERAVLPPATDDKRCPNCSLVHVCLPSAADGLDELCRKTPLFQCCEAEVVE